MGKTGKKILLVMDSPMDQVRTEKMLRENGYEVVGKTHRMSRARSIYLEERPNLVMADLELEEKELGGLELLAMLQEENPNARILLCSKHATLSSVKLSLERGACGVITKPISPARLPDNVERALSYPVGRKRSPAKRVMILSRSSEYQKMLEEKLERCGCNVMAEMFSGESCLKMYERVEPDLVITDMELEGEATGLYVLSAIRAAHPAARVMVFAGSDNSRASDMIYDAFTRGACGILKVPFEGLADQLETCWSNKQVRQRDAGRRVLVVGKSASERTRITGSLERNGYKLAGEVESAEECAAFYRERGADVVIVNSGPMDDINVYDVVKTLREYDLYARVMIFDTEGWMGERSKMAAFELGARDIFGPEDVKDLGSRLEAGCLVWVPGS